MCLFSACNSFVQIDASPLVINSAELFQSDEVATSAVVGLYNQMTTLNMSGMNGGITVYSALSADEIYPGGSNTNYEVFYENAVPESNGIVNLNFWGYLYRSVYRCNAIIEGIDHSAGLSEATRKQLQGEAYFVRAFNYFYLVNLFGKVPLSVETDYRKNAIAPRSEINEVYAQIIEDLKQAALLLPQPYVSQNRVRPNYYTALALLSRTYLYTGQWEQAEKTATAIIDGGMYQREDDLSKVFQMASTETIWQLYRDAVNTSDGAAFIPLSASATPPLILTDELMQRFEGNDQRKAAWTGYNTVDNNPLYYPYKYKIRSGLPVQEYTVVFRLAEQYLIRAEARAHRENLEDAKDDVDVIRNRAGLGGTTATDIPALLTEIESQRALELFCEWGHRWFDLKRTGRADAVLAPLKSGWRKEAALLPIPASERLINVFLDQNPGYND